MTRRSATRQRFSSRIVAPMVMAADLACLLLPIPVALILHRLIVAERLNPGVNTTAVLVITFAFFLIRVSRDAYGQPFGRAGTADQGVVFDFLLAALLGVTTIWQLGIAESFSRGLTILYTSLAIGSLFLSRIALRHLVRRLSAAGHIAQKVALFGAEEAIARRAFQLLQLERLPHLEIIGIADDRKTRVQSGGYPELPFIGGFPELVELAREGQLDQVLIAVSDITQDRLEQIVERLSAVSIDVSLIPREALVLSTSYKVSFVGSAPVLTIWERPVRDMSVFLKSFEDKMLAGMGLLLLLPLLIGVALAIKLTSPGPILFKQKRFGFNNTEIEVFKFRSMRVDLQDETGANRTVRSDPRVTPVGRILRRLSLDELPQLWNVLRGDMSIVGPRPHATMMRVGDEYYFDAVRGYAARHRVKPGITGLAQIRGLRGEIDTIEKAKRRVDYDRYYIDNWSLFLDFKIILETIAKVVSDRNAY